RFGYRRFSYRRFSHRGGGVWHDFRLEDLAFRDGRILSWRENIDRRFQAGVESGGLLIGAGVLRRARLRRVGGAGFPESGN
ncbi:MAG TPA: hypothetical protein DD438_08845, partial [Verrucomicrobiales bacterium]|nr:hypothetical protein [Verrucomicrobiales bacterium]